MNIVLNIDFKNENPTDLNLDMIFNCTRFEPDLNLTQIRSNFTLCMYICLMLYFWVRAEVSDFEYEFLKSLELRFEFKFRFYSRF